MSGRRILLGMVAGLATAPQIAKGADTTGPLHQGIPVTGIPSKGVSSNNTPSPDAELVTLAAELRDLEELLNEGCKAQDEYDDTCEGAEVLDAIGARIKRMTEIPAAGLVGVAAKAGRLCWSYQAGSNLMNIEVPLLDSLAEDLARLAPEAVGGAAAFGSG